jgi:2-polyprenyl-6-hydroxyphenyl methylase/3-demethylubiquinone-9 3-methyltransferase
MAQAQPGSVIPDEVAQFNRLAAQWWDPAGPMRALHAMNKLRIGWIAARIHAQFAAPQRVLDVGCGAGLAAEALAERGHEVLGLDAAPDAIAAARAHAAGRSLPLSYREGAPETLASEGARFPVVTALEVIEHVADPAAFLKVLGACLEPGGLLFVSTINRTMRSLGVAKLGAEYVTRLLPVGTHDWRRFVTPAELDRAARPALRLQETSGMSYDLRAREWRLSSDLSINYIAMLRAPAPSPCRRERG